MKSQYVFVRGGGGGGGSKGRGRERQRREDGMSFTQGSNDRNHVCQSYELEFKLQHKVCPVLGSTNSYRSS